MSMTTEKMMVGVLGLVLFASVMTVGVIDSKHRKKAKPAAAAPAAVMNPDLIQGRALFEKYSCVACHGLDGKGGVTNLNAQTAQQIPPLTFVAESFSKQELQDKILNGVAQVQRLSTNRPAPPLYMPSFRELISKDELALLVRYLDSLMPPKAKGEW